jgi:hypothetical protein
LKNALSHIAQEEKIRSSKQRLTSLQKNRIAMKYVKFRENQNIKEYDDGKQLREVSGGYDRAIEHYSKLKTS